MTYPMAIARLQARNLLADVQVAIASGDWIVSDGADPVLEIIRLETILGLPSPAETIERATDRLAGICGDAIQAGDWMTPANDRNPMNATPAPEEAAATNRCDQETVRADILRLAA